MNMKKIFKPIIENFSSLAYFYRYMRDSKSLRSDVQFRDSLGFFFNGNSSMEDGTFEPDETKIFEALVGFFDFFINIGANTGYYSCKALSKGINTIAFEPNQLNSRILLRNIYVNKFSAYFQFFPIALSDLTGVLQMYGSGTGASLIEGWARQTKINLVPVSTFDNVASKLVYGKRCLILMDIEGAELSCLKGMHELLSSSENNVYLIEIVVREHQPSGVGINPNLLETFKIMYEYGYYAYTANSNPRVVDICEISKICSTHIDTLGTHNFLFLKNSDILNYL